jgi:hypothetical protein
VYNLYRIHIQLNNHQEILSVFDIFDFCRLFHIWVFREIEPLKKNNFYYSVDKHPVKNQYLIEAGTGQPCLGSIKSGKEKIKNKKAYCFFHAL